MQQIQDFLSGPLGQLIVNVVFAIIILIVGYIIARIIAAIVKGILKRVDVDNRIAGALSEPENEQRWPVEDVVGRVTFWIIMLFAIVAALDQLNLTTISQPLTNFLDQLTTVYLPRLFAGGVLALIAWLVATVVRFLARRILAIIKLDERLGNAGAVEEGETISFSSSIATALFWFTFLLFLPSIFAAFGLIALADMFADVFATVVSWLPVILQAFLIGVVGWIIARIVRQIAISLLAAFGVNKLGARAGMSSERSLAVVLANIIYYALLVIILIAVLDALNLDSISQPLTAMLDEFFLAIPGIIGAVVIILLAYFFGRLIAGICRDLLANVGFDSIPGHLGLSWSATTQPSAWVGSLVLIVIMIFAATYAAEVLGSEFLTVALGQFIAFLWLAFLAAIIFAFGLYFGNLGFGIVQATGVNNAKLLARLVQIVIVIFAGALALQTLDVASDIVNLAFGISLAAIALAIALAFGLGGRETAGRELEGFITAWREPHDGVELPDIPDPAIIHTSETDSTSD